jgi:pimeloyl-ACP methyl ester carboxylesterase
MPTASIDGVRLKYQRSGSGPPVLLIMGLAMPGEGWRRQVQDLRRDHELCWYDNRGIGGSDSPAGLYTTRLLAKDGLGLMDELGWSSAHVVGISMGGMIAQHLAMLAPRRVRSLSLIATHAGGLGGRPTLRGVATFLRAQLEADDDRRRHLIGDLLFSPEFIEAHQEDLYEDLGPIADQRCSPWGMLGQLAAALTHMSRRRLHQLRGIPTLVITGTGDILVRPQNSGRIADRLHGRLLEIPQAGHGVTIEADELVNSALREHFARA